MPDLATAQKNPIEKKIDYLNASEISTPEEAIEVLRELRNIGGKLIKGSVLEKSIENYLGELEVYDVPSVIEALKDFETKTDDNFDKAAVPVAKIDELVDEYEEYLEKGFDSEEAADKIYKENKGLISRKTIDSFVQRQREIFENNLKKVNETKKPLTQEKLIDLNKYRQESEATTQNIKTGFNEKDNNSENNVIDLGKYKQNTIDDFYDLKPDVKENKKYDLKPENKAKKVIDLDSYIQGKEEVEDITTNTDAGKYESNKNKVEEQVEIISKEQFKFENKVEEELLKYQKQDIKSDSSVDEKVKEELKKVSRDISKQTFESVVLNEKDVDIETVDRVVEKISDELPYSIIKPEEKETFKANLKEEIEVVTANIAVEAKTEEISQKIILELKKDERTEELIKRNSDVVENKIETAVKNVILGEEVVTKTEQINDLNSEIIRILKEEDVSDFKHEAPVNKTAIKTIDLELNKWVETNRETVQDFRGDHLEKIIDLQIQKENPYLSEEQKVQVQKYKQLIREIYYSDSTLEKYKNDAVNNASKTNSPGQINQAWTDLKGITNLLKKKPGDVKDIFKRYDDIKKGLGNINLPFDIKECRSFENIANVLTNPQINVLFGKAQKYITYLEKLDSFSGGLLGKAGMKGANYIIERIGNQAVKAFAENSLKIIAEKGLQEGFGIVLRGILSGGVQAGASAAASGAAVAGGAAATGVAVVGGAALSATGVGAIVVAAATVLGVVKKVVNKIKDGILKSLGIESGLFGAKQFFQDNFGKGLGGILGKGVELVELLVVGTIALVAAVSAAAVGPIIIAFFVGLFGYQMLQGHTVSSLVPPTTLQDSTDINEEGGQVFDPGSVHSLNLSFNVPVVGAEFTRADLVNVAQSLLGLPYFWGGKYPHKGANPSWGQLKTVTADKSWSTGLQIPSGLDCSGFVDWAYFQLTGRQISNGGGSADICNLAAPVARASLKAGDVGCMDGHVALCIGTDPTDGEPLFIQAVGQRYRDNSKGLVAGQVLILKEGIEYNGYVGPTFTSYGRPNVTFKDN